MRCSLSDGAFFYSSNITVRYCHKTMTRLKTKAGSNGWWILYVVSEELKEKLVLLFPEDYALLPIANLVKKRKTGITVVDWRKWRQWKAAQVSSFVANCKSSFLGRRAVTAGVLTACLTWKKNKTGLWGHALLGHSILPEKLYGFVNELHKC